MGTRQKPIAVIDAETDPFKKGRFPIPFIWGFYDGQTYQEFTDLAALPGKMAKAAISDGMQDTSEFIPFLEEREIIVYAHNGGKFDFHLGLLEYMDPFETVMIIAGRLARFKIGLCEFRDSFNILPVALAEYQKQEFDYTLLEREQRYKPHNWKKIREYLYSDCINQFDMVSKFQARYGRHLTQAGASMKYWAKVTGNKAPQSTPEFYHLFKVFYYGGRTEAFEAGIIKNKLELIDINSAYPEAMLSEHPFSLEYVYSTDAEYDETKITGGDFYHVVCNSHGAFPFRVEDGSLIFPNDNATREYHVTGWELQAALDTHTVSNLKVIGFYSFTESINFSDYILPLYDERLEAKANNDKAGDLFNKLLMNSLYGKFASNPEEYGEFLVLDPEYVGLLDLKDSDGKIKRGVNIEDDELFNYSFAGELGPWALARRPLFEERQRYYNVATAASITGYVRAKLWRAICQCHGVVYCDTDSIVCRRPGPLPLGKALGEWSIDGEFTEGAIAGKKLYAFKYKKGTEPTDKKTGKKKDYKTACKGGRLEAPEIYRVAKGETVLYEPESPTYSVFQKPQFISKSFKLTAKRKLRI